MHSFHINKRFPLIRILYLFPLLFQFNILFWFSFLPHFLGFVDMIALFFCHKLEKMLTRSWFSCQEGKGREVGAQGIGKLLGVDKKGGACGAMLLILMFHQLGFPVIICCTGELWRTPLFMPSFPLRFLAVRKERWILFLWSFSFPFLAWCPNPNTAFVENLRGPPWVD